MNNELTNPTKRQWVSLVLCVLAGCIAPFFQYCHGTLTDYMMDKYSIDFTHMGYVNTTYAFACGIGLFIVGALVNKLGCKKWTMLGIFLMMIGHAIFFFAPSYAFLIISRIISGFGNACIYNAAYTLAVKWFQGTNKMAVATAGMTAADGIGTFAALYLFAMLMAALGNTKGTVITIAIVAVIWVTLMFILKEPDVNIEGEDSSQDAPWKYNKILNRNTISHSLVVSGVLGGLGIANYWGPSMLNDMGMSTTMSGFWSSMFTASGIVSGLLFGAISDKLGKRRPTMLLAGILMVAGYAFMVIGNMVGNVVIFTIAMIAIGFMAYVAYPIGFALIGETCNAKIIGPANGVIQGASFLIGMFIFQQIVSVAKDATGSYYAGLAVCLVLTALFDVVGAAIAKDKVVLESENKGQVV